MKRHEALIPLSREHHETLILAQLLKKGAPGYRGLPADIPGKVIYAKQLYRENIEEHFREEEILIDRYLSHLGGEISVMGNEIIAEHKELRQRFNALQEIRATEDELDELGKLLELHVRKEERQFFPLIERLCPEEVLDDMTKLLAELKKGTA